MQTVSMSAMNILVFHTMHILRDRDVFLLTTLFLTSSRSGRQCVLIPSLYSHVHTLGVRVSITMRAPLCSRSLLLYTSPPSPRLCCNPHSHCSNFQPNGSIYPVLGTDTEYRIQATHNAAKPAPTLVASSASEKWQCQQASRGAPQQRHSQASRRGY